MHLIDALARLQLTSLGKVASSVPIVYQGKKMTLLKGDAAVNNPSPVEWQSVSD